MKKQLIVNLFAVVICGSINAQITNMSASNLYEGSTFIGFLGRGALMTGGWAATPDILTLTYHKRDFAIGGWRKSDGYWGGASLYINSDNNNVGIGTTSPAYNLDVNGSLGVKSIIGSADQNLIIGGYDNGQGGGQGLEFNAVSNGIGFKTFAIGVSGWKTRLLIHNGGIDVNGSITGPTDRALVISGYDNGQGGGQGLEFNAVSNGIGFKTFEMGVSGWKTRLLIHNGGIDVKGKILASEIEVKDYAAILPDYVFDANYQLKSLAEVEAYVKTHKHLPEVPSESEFKEKGMNLVEMNALLLKKVEELTLYSIEQEKKFDKQAAEIEQLKATVKSLIK